MLRSAEPSAFLVLGGLKVTHEMVIYIYAVKYLSGPSLALSGVTIWSNVGSLSGPSLFLLILTMVSSDF